MEMNMNMPTTTNMAMCLNELDPAIMRLDVAVIENSWQNNLAIIDPNAQNRIELDIINISYADFTKLYYFNDPVNPTFEVLNILKTHPLYSYMSFSFKFRTFECGKEFCLYDEILSSYCKDAGVTPSQFTTISLMNLQKQIYAIDSISDVYQNRTGTVLKSALTLDEINKYVSCETDGTSPTTKVVLKITCTFIPTPAMIGIIKYRSVDIVFSYLIEDFLVETH